MSSPRVPFVDLRAAYLDQQAAIDSAIRATIEAADFVLGKSVRDFEGAFAGYCGVSNAIGCANGTDALELVLEAAGIGPGDEVITTSHTFVATVEAIVRSGATAVLVDVDEESLLMDPAQLDDAVSSSTKAIIPVHLYGSCAPMEDVRNIASSHDLLVIEDASQAHGASYRGRKAGSLGDAATFSFYPSKNLGGFGDGGIVVTDDATLADRCRLIRDHGKRGRFEHSTVGRNSRLDGLQASILSVRLSKLDADNQSRREAARRYSELLDEVPLPIEVTAVSDDVSPVHHLFVVQMDDRDEAIGYLEERGISTGVHYPTPVHRQPAFSDHPLVRSHGSLERTKRACDRILSLPMYPQIASHQQERVIECLRGWFEARRRYRPS